MLISMLLFLKFIFYYYQIYDLLIQPELKHQIYLLLLQTIILHDQMNYDLLYQILSKHQLLPCNDYQCDIFVLHCNSFELLLSSSIPYLCFCFSAIMKSNCFGSKLNTYCRINTERFSTFIKCINQISFTNSCISNNND